MNPWTIYLYFGIMLFGAWLASMLAIYGVQHRHNLTTVGIVIAGIVLTAIVFGAVSARVLTGQWPKL